MYKKNGTVFAEEDSVVQQYDFCQWTTWDLNWQWWSTKSSHDDFLLIGFLCRAPIVPLPLLPSSVFVWLGSHGQWTRFRLGWWRCGWGWGCSRQYQWSRFDYFPGIFEGQTETCWKGESQEPFHFVPVLAIHTWTWDEFTLLYFLSNLLLFGIIWHWWRTVYCK